MPDWLDELPTDAGPPWLRMGTRGTTEDRWLVIDPQWDAERELKHELVSTRPTEVWAELTSGEVDTHAAGGEVLALVTDWLRVYAPSHLSDPPAARHPLESAALMVPEDLCLVDHSLRLVAASVCFPSHWRVDDKIGLPIAAVHAPVDHYAEGLQSKVDTFLSRLPPGRIAARRNLSVHDHPDLFAPGPAEVYSHTASTDGADHLWLRSERQTLRRLVRSGMILFTIKTQVCPMAQLAERPDVAARMATRFDALVDHERECGREARVPPWLPGWLRAAAGGD